ncbi:MAG: hypothetical protein WD449_01350, partial [Candidatus Babeliales bacterium]
MHEYLKADGSELVDKANRKAKMKAVHSSSALVCNFFEYWRDKNKKPLTKSIGLNPEIKLLSFEQKFSMGMQGTMPNLDIFFLLEDGSPIAIESKFTEWMDKSESSFVNSYFANGVKRWDRAGLPKCQLFAEHIYTEKQRKGYFNEAQLLKHALGVANKLGNQATLKYLYYDLDETSEVGKMHKQEIQNFKDSIEGELNFEAITYQEVFQKLEKFEKSGKHSDYLKYLKNRYFG